MTDWTDSPPPATSWGPGGAVSANWQEGAAPSGEWKAGVEILGDNRGFEMGNLTGFDGVRAVATVRTFVAPRTGIYMCQLESLQDEVDGKPLEEPASLAFDWAGVYGITYTVLFYLFFENPELDCAINIDINPGSYDPKKYLMFAGSLTNKEQGFGWRRVEFSFVGQGPNAGVRLTLLPATTLGVGILRDAFIDDVSVAVAEGNSGTRWDPESVSTTWS